MKADQTPAEPAQTPADESATERHIVEIMGPAERLDGSKEPAPAVIEPAEAEAAAAPVMTSAPEVDIPALDDAESSTLPDDQSEDTAVEEDAPASLSEEPPATEAAEDAALNEAVDDITRSEADKLLPPESDDTEPPVVMKSSLGERIKQAYFKWWDNRIARYSTFGALVLLIGVVAFVQPVRAAVFNLLGVRTSISVTAIDGSTSLPLKNVTLKVGSGEVKTNDDGYAKLYGIKLGKRAVLLQKAGFATNKRTLTLGMRTVDLGDVELKAVGTQYTFVFTDYFSGKAVKEAAVTSGEATTASDKSGKAVLTVQPSDERTVAVTVEKRGYRTEKLSIAADTTQQTSLRLVPAAKEVFISKESGKYDLYKMDLDGKNKKVLLAGTGLETPALSVLADPAGSRAALVSTRDDKRNKDGYLLSALTIVNIETGDSEVIEHAEQVILLGWSGTSLIYEQTVAGASAANPSRQKIMSYDYNTSKRIQVANANYFSGAMLIGDKVYYVVSSTDPSVEGSFIRSGIDATNKKTLQIGQIWQLYRIGYKTLKIQTATAWYDYTIGNGSVTQTASPASYASRKYVESTDGKQSAWVDDRDANGALMVYSVADGKDKQLTLQKGMTEVTRWANENVVIYRTVSANEVTEYAVSIAGGEPQRLTAVSAVY